MHTKDFSLKLKSLDQSGSFSGLASSYNSVDLGGDLIMPGAYRQAISSQGDGFPLLFSHDSSKPLGLAKISDSSAGLVIDGQMMLSDPQVKAVYDHLKFKSIRGLSVGYQVPPDKSTYDPQTNIRTIREMRLFEISLVAIPMDQNAQVQSVKSLSQVEALLRGVKPRDVDGVLLEQLKGIDSALKSLLTKDALCACPCDACVAGDCESCADECDQCDQCVGCVAARTADDAKTLSLLKGLASELERVL